MYRVIPVLFRGVENVSATNHPDDVDVWNFWRDGHLYRLSTAAYQPRRSSAWEGDYVQANGVINPRVIRQIRWPGEPLCPTSRLVLHPTGKWTFFYSFFTEGPTGRLNQAYLPEFNRRSSQPEDRGEYLVEYNEDEKIQSRVWCVERIRVIVDWKLSEDGKRQKPNWCRNLFSRDFHTWYSTEPGEGWGPLAPTVIYVSSEQCTTTGLYRVFRDPVDDDPIRLAEETVQCSACTLV